MELINRLTRTGLQLWARSGRAPGYLHRLVDQYSSPLASTGLIRSVYKGNKIACDLKDHVQSRIYFMGAYEPIEAWLFSKLIRPESHIVDAGANIGFYSLVTASHLGDQGRVYAFEPVPQNHTQLEKNISLSRRQNIEVFKMGLWNKEDTLSFCLDETMEKNAGSFTVGPVEKTSKKFSCPVTTLDSLVAEGRISRVDLVKMDIEGAELFALQGALKTIDRFKPTFLMEINQGACQRLGYSSDQIDNIFSDQGYKIFRVATLPENSAFVDSTLSIRQSNVFYISPHDSDRFQTHWNTREIRRLFANG